MTELKLEAEFLSHPDFLARRPLTQPWEILDKSLIYITAANTSAVAKF